MPRLFTLKVKSDQDTEYKTLSPNEIKSIIQDMSLLKHNQLNGLQIFMTNGGKYPSKTDAPCWWDRHKIPDDIHPIPIPRKIIKDISGNIIEIYGDGFFYSFNNCKAYLEEMKMNMELENLEILFEYFYPGKILKRAGDWRCIRGIGTGDVEISIFRSESFNMVETYGIIFLQALVRCNTINRN